MALPPPPSSDPQGSFVWTEWFRKLQAYLVSTGSVPWNIIDKTGSSLSDLAIKNHDVLNSIGGLGTKHLAVTLEGSVTYDFGSIASATTSTTTLTITGAAIGHKCLISYSTAPDNGIVFDAYVSAADTVTIRAINITGAAINPPSRTYYILVLG